MHDVHPLLNAVPTERAACDFIQKLCFEQIPEEIVWEGVRSLLDTLGVAAAGTSTQMSKIAKEHAVQAYGSGSHSSRILFDGRGVSVVGAAMAGAATIDSVDAHDGHVLTKGHAGAALVPALLAFADLRPSAIAGRELLTSLVMGYEISTRAGIALHRSANAYHTSGAWNALGCAAIGARWYGLDPARTLEALGIAEYHGPRSDMMRCIDAPTMVKDGSMWGAASGTSAALLAKAGFTGAPAVTVTGADAHDIWADLGDRWYMGEQYLKPHAVCRWAQPAVHAVIDMMRSNSIAEEDVTAVEVATFAAAVRLATRHPATTEQAQYSLPFPVANALVHGDVPMSALLDPQDSCPRVRHWLNNIAVVESAESTALFPGERLAVVRMRLRDGSWVSSEPTAARGGAESPLSDEEVFIKFGQLSNDTLGRHRSKQILEIVTSLTSRGDATALCNAVLA